MLRRSLRAVVPYQTKIILHITSYFLRLTLMSHDHHQEEDIPLFEPSGSHKTSLKKIEYRSLLQLQRHNLSSKYGC